MADERPLKIAIVAGEESGDLLGADLVRALKRATGREVRLVGLGAAISRRSAFPPCSTQARSPWPASAPYCATFRD